MNTVAAGAWETLRVSDIADFGSGEQISVASLAARSTSAFQVPVFGGNGIAGYTNRALITNITVILGRVGQKCGVVYRTDEPAWVTDNALYARRFKRPLDVRFLALILENARLNDLRNRNDLPLITQGILRGVVIQWPASPVVQAKIADTFELVDQEIDALDRLIRKERAIKQGMMQELLAGKTRLPGFTQPWIKAAFEELAAPVHERTDPRTAPANTKLVELEHIESGGGRLLTSTTAQHAVSLKTVFLPGDVLFGKLRAYLRKYWLADFSGICSTEIWALRAKPTAAGAYIRYLVETDRFIEVASGGYGTHMPRSDWGALRGIEFEVPPVDEQEAIASVLQDADSEIEILHMRLKKAKAIKQGMMQELLTGRTRLPVAEAVA